VEVQCFLGVVDASVFEEGRLSSVIVLAVVAGKKNRGIRGKQSISSNIGDNCEHPRLPLEQTNRRIAIITWELTILDTCMSHDYLDAIATMVCPPNKESRQSTHNSTGELDDRILPASEVLLESFHGAH